jgi:hypothetical protein
MYWPNGVPRVYAVNGPDIAYVSSDENRNVPHSPRVEDPDPLDTREDEEGHDIQHNEEERKQESQTNPSPDTSNSKWEDEAIKGVCVSRSGQMFATISESSIALWQTRVC